MGFTVECCPYAPLFSVGRKNMEQSKVSLCRLRACTTVEVRWFAPGVINYTANNF